MTNRMVNKRVFFTGITGLLGKYFIEHHDKGYELHGLANSNQLSDIPHVAIHHADITNKKAITSLIEHIKPSVVVHAASIGNVDYCEKHKEEAKKINVLGTKYITQACKTVGARLVFVSSNAVYDGNHPPYAEESKCAPVDTYGKTKVAGERIVQQSGIDYCIVRLMTMYGWPFVFGRGNPVTWVIDQLRQNKKIKVVDDIYNNHLWAGQAADIIWKIITTKKTNEQYNVSGSECVSRYELALQVASVFNLDVSLISPVPSSYFKNIAPRPKDTCFDTSKTSKDFAMHLYSIKEGLQKMKKELR